MKEMKYCADCGAELVTKFLDSEDRDIPYCPHCGEYRFPVFNTAVSMVVMNSSKDKILLIKQYGRDSYILVAGYVNQGEDAEDAARREVFEEMGLKVETVSFNRSHYYEPSNTLMLNFTVTVADEHVHTNEEIDSYKWFSVAEARANIREGSLAQKFLNGFLDGTYNF